MNTDEDMLGEYDSGGEDDEELIDNDNRLVHTEPAHESAQNTRRIIKPPRGPRTLNRRQKCEM